MEFRSRNITVFASIALFMLVLVSTAQTAPNNSTTVTVKASVDSKNVTIGLKGVPVVTLSSNVTSGGNKTGNDSGEDDCEAEPEPESTPGVKNGTTTGGQRQGKELPLQDKDKYKGADGVAEPEPVKDSITNSTASKTASQPKVDAEKLQGGNSSSTTTEAPAIGRSSTLSSVWANVILATLLSSFTYSAL